jgi:hypothetical protein
MALRSLFRNRTLWFWGGVWVLGLVLMVVQVRIWDQFNDVNYQDAFEYKHWSEILAHQRLMPTEDTWQYPPGAAFLLLVPRIGVHWLGTAYEPSFMVTMILVDLAGLGVMIYLARRTGRNIGVWIWLLTMPLLQATPILRFDLVPTVLVMAALALVHRRPAWFGALIGLGAAIKIWPIVALFGEWERRRLLTAVAAAAVVIALVFAAAAHLFGNQSTFFENQDVRGLQVEAVGGMPWYLRQTVTGKTIPTVHRNGTMEIANGVADAIARVLKWLGLLVVVAAALWWVARDRAIRRGRTYLAEAAVSIDFVFTVVLLQVVVSRVLSPQFMVWLIGLSAVTLTAGTRRMARPGWLAVGAIALTAVLYQSPANMLIRNTTLLLASLDAALAMAMLLRNPEERSVSRGPRTGAIEAPEASWRRLDRPGGAVR